MNARNTSGTEEVDGHGPGTSTRHLLKEEQPMMTNMEPRRHSPAEIREEFLDPVRAVVWHWSNEEHAPGKSTKERCEGGGVQHPGAPRRHSPEPSGIQADAGWQRR
jgi:hypothetical protein